MGAGHSGRKSFVTTKIAAYASARPAILNFKSHEPVIALSSCPANQSTVSCWVEIVVLLTRRKSDIYNILRLHNNALFRNCSLTN